jgi:hypothetical protein
MQKAVSCLSWTRAGLLLHDNVPKIAARWPQGGSMMVKTVQDGSKMAQDGQDVQNIAQEGPKLAQ